MQSSRQKSAEFKIFVNFRKFSTYAEMKENLKQVIEQWKQAQIDRKKHELENDFK